MKVGLIVITLTAIPAGVAHGDELPRTPGATTVVVLPDTERYSDDYPQHFEAQGAWIAAERDRRNIACVVHLGDITQHNAPAEWQVARRAFDKLGGRVPLVLAAGNHDYDGNAPKRDTSRLSEYFPVAEMRGQPSFGGVFEEGRLENSFHVLRIGRRDWIILSLEMGPRDSVVDWANRVLSKHPDRLAMIVTHAYLFRGNVRYDHRLGRQRASPHGWGNDGEELWQKLVRRHRNVMIVLSGHVSTGGLGYLASEGDYGNTVHQMMVDYEKLRGGGMGFLRLLEFLPDGKTVQVRTWSPVLRESRSSELEEFRLELRGPTRDRPMPGSPGPASALAHAPRHRWSFGGRGGDGAKLEDSVGGRHAILRSERSGSRLDGRGRLLLEGEGRVDLPEGLLEGLEDISFEVWFTPTAKRYRWNSVVRFGDADDWLTYVFRTLTVHRAEIAVARHNEDIQRSLRVRRGSPMHVVVTYDADGGDDGTSLLSWYHDGESLGSMRTRLRLSDVEDSGHRVGPFAGRIDELRVYAHALSPEEVRGTHGAGPNTVRVARGDSTPPENSKR